MVTVSNKFKCFDTETANRLKSLVLKIISSNQFFALKLVTFHYIFYVETQKYLSLEESKLNYSLIQLKFLIYFLLHLLNKKMFKKSLKILTLNPTQLKNNKTCLEGEKKF